MIRFPRRAAARALIAVAAGGLAVAIPATAEAHSKSSDTQVEVCVKGPASANFYLVGSNQNGDWVTSYTAGASANGCYSYSGWWWQVNRSFEFHFRVAGGNWKWNPVYIPKSAVSHGWTVETITD